MVHPDHLAVALIAFAAAMPAAAQDVQSQFKPEVDVYFAQGSRTRFIFNGALTQAANGQSSEGEFISYFEIALRPMFRRELRNTQDVFRRRFLTFRAGYEYRTSFIGSASHENRGIAELTARYPLAAGIVIVDRNRGDFRFVKGRSFSARYRNRLWIERDTKLGAFAFTPYIYDEIFYDSRYDTFTTDRAAAGVQFPVGIHVVLEPYFQAQLESRGATRHTRTLGFKISLFL
jgi:hypothetical protein